jgi:hypothetical protein
MRKSTLLALVMCGILALPGAVRAAAQGATPVAGGATETFILVERAEHVTIVDIGDPGTSPGDITVWGPDPLYDEANEIDTGAVTQGSCHALNAEGDNHCYETIVFADGSTLAIQGVQLGSGGPSVTTIVGGSGKYLGATGTLTVTTDADRFLWTKEFAITLE